MTTRAPLDPDVAAALAALPFDLGGVLGGSSDESIAEIRASMSENAAARAQRCR